VAAPDIERVPPLLSIAMVCLADKELAGREGAGRRRRSAHLRGHWETETANRYEQLDQFDSIGGDDRRTEGRLSGWRKEVSHIRRNLPVPAKNW
jgi:hypothetical protein